MTYWERLLAEYIGGGDSPISPTLIAKSITTNGTYNAVDDEADGYSSVSVNVPNTSTLKGTPPLIFKTSEEQLRDWTIYGNDYEHKYSTSGTLPRTFTTQTAGNADDWSIEGNDNIGKNICSILNFVDINTNNVVMTADKTAGTISVYTTAAPTTSTQQSCGTFSVSESGNYLLSGVPSTAPNGYLQIYIWDDTNSQRARAWDKTSSSEQVTKTIQMAQVYLDKDCTYHVNVRVQTAYGTQTTPVTVSPMIRLDGTSSTFEPYQVGIGQRTKNIFTETGSEMLQVTSGGALRFGKSLGNLLGGSYTFSADISINNNVFFTFRSGNTYTSSEAINVSPTTITIPDNLDEVILRTGSNVETSWVNYGYTKIMIRHSETSDGYIPYGYQIPITVSQQGQPGTNYNIYIGDSPLTEGETVSKTSTGVDIAAIAGTNTISTDLYNKPSMSIEGVDYVGVGRHISGDRYEIQLECSADVTPYDPNAEESNTSYVYNSSTYALDTNFQYKTALIDLPGTGRYTITKTLGSTFKIEELTGPTPWGGIDHYIRVGNPITPSGTSYTSIGSAVDCLLVTYYDDTVDTLTPQEIRESITVSAHVYKRSTIEFSGPLTEGEILTPAMIPDRHKYIETISGAVNVLENFGHLYPGHDYGEYEIGITYANMNSTLVNKTVNQNGTYVSAYDNVNGYTSVAVNVPNTYTSEDESKVVSSGALVAQTTTSVTTNGIVDTTTISSVSVNVPDIIYYKNDVTFYDYDGTIIASYSAAEFAELTELPANPTHTGLVSKGWNWTLADAKTFVAAHGFLPIGQCYDPVDDKLRIDIELVPETLSPYLCLGVNGTAVVDWGDGSATDTITGSSASTAYFTPQHTYAAAGKYTITVDITGEAGIISTSGTNGACRILAATNATPSYEQQNAVYKSAVVGVHLCSKVTLQTYAFKNLYSLRYVTLDTTRMSVDRWFDGCLGLTTLIFPPSVTSVGTVGYELSGLCVVSLAKTNSITAANAFNKCYALKELAIPEDTAEMTGICMDCYSITRANIPSTWTKVKGAIFIGARSLRSVVIPSGATEIESQAFSKCWSLAELDIPDSVTTIGTYAFEQCYSLKFIKFHSATPPTVAASNAFSNLPTTCTIYVPTGSLADYTSASSYPSSSTYTYVEY